MGTKILLGTVASTTHTTTMANAATVQKEWLLVDAENEVLGRLASKIAAGYPLQRTFAAT